MNKDSYTTLEEQLDKIMEDDRVKELIKKVNDLGNEIKYLKKRCDELRKQRDFLHYPILMCYEPGGCTNPHRDCVNCPSIHSNGNYITTTDTHINSELTCSHSENTNMET